MVGCLGFRGWRALLVFSLFFIVLGLCAPEAVLANTKEEAYGLIELADDSISSAFEAVLEAERSGANVSGMVVELNEAVSLLLEAKFSFRNGDFRGVVESAGRSVEIAQVVKDEASILRVSALSNREFLFKVSLISSLVGIPSFLIFMFILWRWIKCHYIRKILKLRPEVASDD